MDDMSALVSMGFPRAQAAEMLDLAGGDLDGALMLLTSVPAPAPLAAAAPAAAAGTAAPQPEPESGAPLSRGDSWFDQKYESLVSNPFFKKART